MNINGAFQSDFKAYNNEHNFWQLYCDTLSHMRTESRSKSNTMQTLNVEK